MCKISIIIPAFNAEQYIEGCINSILGQTCRNYEIIIINDGSSDNTGKICERMAIRNRSIHIYTISNSGPAAARKLGVSLAKGDFIMFVDADDWLDKEMLEITYKKARDNNVDLVCTNWMDIDAKQREKLSNNYPFQELILDNNCDMMEHLHGSRYIKSGPVAKLIKRALFQKVDFCTEITIGEDYSMVLQLLEEARRILILNTPLYYRCLRKTGISRSGYTQRHIQALDNYMKWRNYLLERYPRITSEIISYHLEYEMAVITAMCRNKTYDKKVIIQLKKDLMQNINYSLCSKQTPMMMKCSALIIAINPTMFIIIFRIIHILTGR